MSKRTVFYYLPICLFIALTAVNVYADCDKPIAKIVSAQGIVNVQAYGSRSWEIININGSICPGDILRTGRWSRATVIRPSGSGFTLDQNTTLTFTRPKSQECGEGWYLSLLRGIIFIRSRLSECYDVQTPYINAVHKGTEFMVAVDDAKAVVTVYDGLVSGENRFGKVEIKPGQKGIATATGVPSVQAITIRPEDAVQWALYYPPVIDASSYHRQQHNPVRPEPALSKDEGLGQRASVKSIPGNTLTSAINAYNQGDIAQALSQLEQIPPSQQDIHYLTLKAGLLLTVGRVDEAEPLINQAQQQQPNNPDALSLQAIINITKNRQQQAFELANKAVNSNPDSATALIAQSYAQQSLFKLEDAIKSTQQATKLNPNNALAWARLSELALSQGDHKQALKAAQKAQTLNPKLSRTQTVLGFANLAETDTSQAKRQFQQALDLDATDPLARLGLGLAKIRQGDVEDGKNELEAAANLDPNNAIIRSYLGKSYYELRDKDNASTEYGIAKKLDPKDPTPYFYDAILKQTTNRPVEALHDMQKAIELNDNRGVYRSKFLLDKDEAARQVGLGRIYNNLGFDDPANRQAMKSLAIDPSNYSAHRLLSDSYLSKPLYDSPRSSELLQSQLLQPLNYNPIQPSLAYTDLNIIKGVGANNTAFNEYNRLFERNGVRFNTTGLAGTQSTFGDETALSGIYNKFSYSLGQLHYETDGFRQNNDIKHNIYNAFAQYEIAPDINVQGEFRHRETEHGDLEIAGDTNQFRDFKRRNLDQDTYRFGLKYSPAIHSDLLVSFIHADREERVQNQGSKDNLKTKSYDFETQYLFHNDIFNTVIGGGLYRNENTSLTFENAQTFSSPYDISHYLGYLYTTYKPLKDLHITTGLTYDHYRNNQVGINLTQNELNPKLGLLWRANEYVTLRAAGFKVVKPTIFDNQILQPTQLAGFNQFFDDVNGTVAWQYGVGADINTHKDIYAGVEAFKRDLRIPIANFIQKPQQEVYRLYFNWTPVINWAFNSELRFENFRSDGSFPPYPKYVETFFLPTEVRYFHRSGFFGTLKGTFVSQKVGQTQFMDGFNSDFYLVDAAVGYRFPKQYGLISIEAKNLFDSNFVYRDRTFQGNENRPPDFLPERVIFGRLTLNF